MFDAFSYIGQFADSLLDAFIINTVTETISTYKPFIVLCATLYIVIIGYLMIAGRIDKPFEKFMLDSVKILVISAFALNIDTYMNMVVPFVRGFETSVSSAFSGFGKETPAASVYSVMDAAVQDGIDLAIIQFKKAGSFDFFDSDVLKIFTNFIFGVVIIGCTIWLCVPAGAMVMLAKFILAILLGVGPFFIMFLMFKPTARFFDAWVSAVVAKILSIAFVLTVFSGFSMLIFRKIIDGMNVEGDNAISSSVVLIITTAIMSYLIKAVYNEAAALAGGISSEFISAGQSLRKAMDMGKSAGRGAVATGKGIRATYRGTRKVFGKKNTASNGNPGDGAGT